MKKFFKNILKIGPVKIGLILSLALGFIHIKGNSIFEMFELKTLDLKFRARGPLPITDKVCIVTVDEKTYQTMGRWPYPRSVMAEMLDKLNKYEAKVVGFDAMFTVTDRTGANLLKDLANNYSSLPNKNSDTAKLIQKYYEKSNTDEQFAKAIENSKNIILGYSWLTSEEKYDKANDFQKEYDTISSSALMMVTQSENSHYFIPSGDTNGLVTNIDILQKATPLHAYFNARPDSDGLFRRLDLISSLKGSYFPSLTLLATAKYLDSEIFLALDEQGLNSLSILDHMEIPTNQFGQLLVNFRGPRQSIPHYSLVDLLDKTNNILKHQKIMGVQSDKLVSKIDAFKNKIIIFGVTAKGVYDLRNTPFEKDFPGVEVHGNAIDTILKGDFIRAETFEIELLVVVFLLISGLLVSYLIGKLNALSGFLLSVFLLFAYVYIDVNFIFSKGILVTLFLPLVHVFSLYIIITLFKYMKEEKQKKQIKGAFQHYVSSSIVNEMLDDPTKLKLGGEKKELTVLFSDVRGFTSISEKLDAKSLATFLNNYLTPMTDLIIKNKGTIDKYMGDAIMAFVGAPVYFPDHADWACAAALDMMKELKILREVWIKDGLPFVNIGIGINTGDMVVGNMGSNQIFDYTVMGDSVNLGSRLEGLNKEYGTNIIISEFTLAKLVNNKFITRELDWVKVKGKEKPVKIFELIDFVNSNSIYNNEKFLNYYSEAFLLFHSKNFENSKTRFSDCLKIVGDDPVSKLYVERCETFIQHPPSSDWDGVVTMKTK